MRILYLNHTSQMGGAEVSLLGLLRALDRERFEPVVVLPEPGLLAALPLAALPLAAALGEMDIPVEYLPMRRFKRRPPVHQRLLDLASVRTTVPRLVSLIRRYQISLVHSNSTNAHIYGAPAANLCRVPCIWHVRDLVDLGWIGRILFRSSTRIVAISQAVADQVVTYGVPRRRVVCIHNGVDLDLFSPDISGEPLRVELGLPAEEFVAGMVGQFVPWKGHRHFLEAAAFVRQREGRGRFLVVGEDLFGDHAGYRRELEQRARDLGLEQHLQFLGYRTDMPQVLAALDTLVLPSLHEPFGRVLIEAMAMAKPVVATNRGGPREIVEEGITGLLVAPGDSRALAEAMLELMRHSDRAREMGRQARARVEQRFSIQQTAVRIQELYLQLTA